MDHNGQIEELWDDYLQYLIWIGGLQKFRQYGRLFEILHNIQFTYILDRDNNRNEDGNDLREDYLIPDCFDKEADKYFYGHWVSVLEMLLALAIRVDDEFIGDPSEEHPEDFLMEMINNLGLGVYRGEKYRENDVIKIVQKWMNRKFDKGGYGSPFPLKYSCEDQRKIEIWDQMIAYIGENYG